MRSVVVLAMHGAPPRDFPKAEIGEFMSLHARLAGGVSHSPALESRYEELDVKMRSWPRTAQNDPFFTSSTDIAAELERTGKMQVFLGFNEFCDPGLGTALQSAVSSGAERIFVVTPMVTRGGEHSEKDILEAVEKAKASHPGIKFIYAWPFTSIEVADFLSAHVKRFADV